MTKMMANKIRDILNRFDGYFDKAEKICNETILSQEKPTDAPSTGNWRTLETCWTDLTQNIRTYAYAGRTWSDDEGQLLLFDVSRPVCTGQGLVLFDDTFAQVYKIQQACRLDIYCPALLDEWATCINYTRAGITVHLPCPNITIFNSLAKAFRHCEANGSWQVLPHGQPWTNVTPCTLNASSLSDHFNQHSIIAVYLYIAGASLSLMLLIISLAIFYGFRQLRCDRITIHKNLFISYTLTASAWIFYYKLVILDVNVLSQNPVWCQILQVLAKGFSVANYSWMFCECLYLHIIMAHALQTSKKLIKILVLCGWGVPVVLITVYAAVRGTSDENLRNSCWTFDALEQWIYAGPITITILVNICILTNLVWLLRTKLRQIPDAAQSRKAAKALLILIPLFGLQFLMFPMKPHENNVFWHTLYIYCSALLASTQVHSMLRRKWHQYRLMTGHARKNTAITSSTCLDGYSVVDTTSHRSKIAVESHQRNIETMELKCSPLASSSLIEDNTAHVNHCEHCDA